MNYDCETERKHMSYEEHQSKKRYHGILLIVVCVIIMIAVFSQGPIPQDPSYHNFADTRSFFGIPNCLNVLSNIPFVLSGLYGIYVLLHGNKDAFIHPTEKGTYWVLFVSMCFIAAGSAYYHLWPNTETLFWDRLPMTVGFMAVVSILFTEKVDRKFGQRSLLPFIILGVTSVLWWSFTEGRSEMTGDLRLYIVIQMAPVFLTPLVVVLYPDSYTHTNYLYSATGLYVLAKVAELLDNQIYSITFNIISGHSLKHILAAYGLVLLSVMLQKRKSKQI